MIYKDSSDSELISLLKNGDRDAFSEIYSRHWNSMYRSAINVLREDESAMDVVQDVFMWIWNNKESLKIETLRSYLLSSVKYKVANLIRKGKARDRFFSFIEETELTEDPVTDWVEVKELRRVIQDCVDSLPERWKEVYELSRNEHLSNKQIAERLGISEKTVEKHITSSLKRIRISVSQFLFSLIL